MATSKLCNNSALCEDLKSILGTYVPWDKMCQWFYMVAMVTTATIATRNCTITNIMKVFQVHICHKCNR